MSSKQTSIASYFTCLNSNTNTRKALTKDIQTKNIVKTSTSELLPLSQTINYESKYEKDPQMSFIGEKCSHKDYFVSRYNDKYFHISYK